MSSAFRISVLVACWHSQVKLGIVPLLYTDDVLQMESSCRDLQQSASEGMRVSSTESEAQDRVYLLRLGYGSVSASNRVHLC